MTNLYSRHDIAILGAGAVGLTLAAFLKSVGHRVTLIVREGSAVTLPARVDDEIGGRELVLDDIAICTASRMPRNPRHLIVCTRGEQLDQALDSLLGRLEGGVPMTIAAATLDDVAALARNKGLANPILRMAVGVATWPVSEGHYRVFSLSPRGSSTFAPLASSGMAHAKELATLLTNAGLPARAAPTKPFRWIYYTTLAIEIARLLAFRNAGWELEALGGNPELLRLGSSGMAEAARIARRDGGPVAWIASMLPRYAFELMLKHRISNATAGFREVWRHHGPKTEAQLEFVARQLIPASRPQATTALETLLELSPGRCAS